MIKKQFSSQLLGPHPQTLCSYFLSGNQLYFYLLLYLLQINAIDRLVTSSPDSEDLLWTVWQLCGLAR